MDTFPLSATRIEGCCGWLTSSSYSQPSLCYSAAQFRPTDLVTLIYNRPATGAKLKVPLVVDTAVCVVIRIGGWVDNNNWRGTIPDVVSCDTIPRCNTFGNLAPCLALRKYGIGWYRYSPRRHYSVFILNDDGLKVGDRAHIRYYTININGNRKSFWRGSAKARLHHTTWRHACMVTVHLDWMVGSASPLGHCSLVMTCITSARLGHPC